MSFNDIFLSVFGNPALAGAFWSVILVAVMYFARSPAHLAILSFSRVFHNSMRLTARAIMRAESRLTNRNREVLLAQGREAVERIIEREFDRVDATVRRDLAEYPALHRQLSEEITQIDDDYKDSTEVPPDPPGWVKAVDAVSRIPGKDPMVASILEDIHGSMIKANTHAIEEYRKSSHKRHEHLKNMMPHWRKVRSVLGQVDKSVTSLLMRSQTIDRHMDEYEEIMKQADRAVRTLSSSSLTNFFISAVMLAIALGGGMINFELIAYPMSQMVEGKREIQGFETSSVAALVIILVEISMGIFLMELLRVTKLFPVIGSLNDKLRVKMAWTAFAFLFGLATVEAGLAFMREVMVEIDQAQRAGASFDAPTWILTAAQMGLGFILPFALMFVAIPLETFMHSLRTVLGIVGIAILRGLAWVLRFIGNIMRFFGRMLVNVYDLVIFAPLWVERKLKNKESDEADALDNVSSTF